MRSNPLGAFIAIVVLALSGASAHATQVQYGNDFTFATQNQSLWSTGAQASWSYDSGFIGGSWGTYANKSAVAFGLNGIVGSANVHVPGTGGTIPNPLWLAWKICPFLCGSEPSQTLPNPIPYATTDTRTGAQVGVTSSGRLGFDVKAAANGGGLGLSLPYQASLLAPAANAFVTGQLLHFGSSGSLRSNATMSIDAPSFTASVNGIIDTNNALTGTGCIIPVGCSSSSSPANIHQNFSIIALDTTKPKPLTALNGLLTLPVILGQDIGIPAGGQTVGHVTLSAPSDQAGGTVAGNQVKLDTNQTILRTTADFGGIAQAALGVPVDVLQPSLSIGVGEIGATLINLQGGINLGMSQHLSFAPNVDVTLSFDQVAFGNNGVELGKSVTFDLGAGMDLMFKTRPSHMTYSFSMGADSLFTNDTGISVDPLFAIKAGCFNLSVGGGIVADIEECALEKEYATTDLVRASVYNKSFGVEGFNAVSFDVALAVPEPGSYALLLAGLSVVGFAARRRS